MSDPKPTLDDVLAAVLESRAAIQQLRAAVLESRAEAREAVQELRVATMGRMDRLQDSLTEQRDDLSVLLGLIDGTHRMAERGLSEARLAFDQQNRVMATVATVERQVRRLQDELRELRDRQ